MVPSERQQPFLLTAAESSEIYSQFILPGLSQLRSTPAEKSSAFFLAAQPGAGKTILRNHLIDRIYPNSTLVVNTDDLREFHPAYQGLLSNKTTFSAALYLVNPDATKWAQQLRGDGIRRRLNIILDVTLGGNSAHYIQSINELKDQGYLVKLAILAVKPELSRLGIHLRYENQVKDTGYGRFVEMEVHDTNYVGLPRNIGIIMDSVTLDTIGVYKRKVYEQKNQLINNAVELIVGTDHARRDFKPGVYRDTILNALDQERTRPWTEVELRYLKIRVQEVEHLIAERGASPDRFRNDISLMLDALVSYKNKGSSR